MKDLKELKELPVNLRKKVINEYNKGYHFLLFYGKFLTIVALILLLEYTENIVLQLSWTYKLIIYASLGYFISFLIKIIEVNLIAKKVIRDLIKNINKK